MPATCALCGTKISKVIGQFPFGNWSTATAATDSQQLAHMQRRSEDYALGKCTCGHVQMLHEYTEHTFHDLYFHSAQEAVMWHEQLVGSDAPYRNMVEFCASEQATPDHIADFGCGPGALLQAFAKYYPEASLYGADFNPRHSFERIHYQHADLNHLPSQPLWEAQMDLVCASHTLEHVLDPAAFLRALAKQLGPQGHIFIEVPDFTENLPTSLIGQANLINLQHIHYFTRDSLHAFAARAGLTVVKERQLRTGYIPRLQVLLKSQQAQTLPKLHHTAAPAVTAQLAQRTTLYQQFAKQVINLCQHHPKIGLWGVGADLYQCVEHNAALKTLIQNGQVVLFDRDYAQHQWCDAVIQDSSNLDAWSHPLVLTPLLAETRVNMHRIARAAKWDIIDPYCVDLSAVDGMAQQSCQICQHDDWDNIDTLTYGDWETNNNALTRYVAQAQIAQCTHCQHVQIITPYSAETFARIYPDNGGPPQMWPDALAEQAYADMLAFMHAPLVNSQRVLDAGCGDGALLKQLAQHHPMAEYTGLDFLHTNKQPDYAQLACDLNNESAVRQTLAGRTFNLITSSHVLEHVINPVTFLSVLAEFLIENGTIFIEVPDATPTPDNHALYQTNLVHPQHIHYFTADTLEVVAHLAGLTVIKSRKVLTETIPRQQILLQAQPHPGESPMAIRTSARPTVTARFAQYRDKQAQWWQMCQALISSQGCAHVWGVGGDWQQLLLAYPELETLVAAGQVILYDRQFADMAYCNATIQPSSQLSTLAAKVLIAPFYLPTISQMKAVAHNWSCQIIHI